MPAPDPAGGKNIKTHQRKKKRVKPADTPDSVTHEKPRALAAIHLGRESPHGSVLPTRQLSAEPHQNWPTWHCCAQRLPVSPAPKRLVSVALILALYALRRFRRAAVSCCAVLCSPDVPPVHGFPPCTSGGLAGFTERIVAQVANLCGKLRIWRSADLCVFAGCVHFLPDLVVALVTFVITAQAGMTVTNGRLCVQEWQGKGITAGVIGKHRLSYKINPFLYFFATSAYLLRPLRPAPLLPPSASLAI